MNILWHSVAPWVKTGYGIQTALFAPRIRDMLGHDVAIFAYAGLEISPLRMGGMLVLPKGHQRVGADVLRQHATMWDADLVISLTDAWVIPPDAVRGLPWAPWVPVDHDPVPPLVASVLKETSALPVAMSRFGKSRLEAQEFTPEYVPHGCDPIYFEEVDRDAARKELGFPADAFIVGMVGSNQGLLNRKGFPQAIEAFSEFQRRYNDSFLYLHTDLQQVGGIDLGPLFELVNLDATHYRTPDRYQYAMGYTEEHMRNVYRALDVLLMPSMGEGFGVPAIEAQACGTPIIATDFSALAELLVFGEIIPVNELAYTAQGAFQAWPQRMDIVEALERVYDYSNAQRSKGSSEARTRIYEQYHPDCITRDYWAPALDRLGLAFEL